MNLSRQYNQVLNEYNDLDHNLYDLEIFIVCYNGKVYKGDECSVYVYNDEDKVSCIDEKGKIIHLTSQDIEHITYNITPAEQDDLT